MESITVRNLLEESRSQLVNFFLEIPLAGHSHDLVCDFSILENQHRGDGSDAVLAGNALLIIDIDLADFQPVFVFGNQFIQNRGDHFAGPTPFRPEINQNRVF
jgi:hypothetical protein